MEVLQVPARRTSEAEAEGRGGGPGVMWGEGSPTAVPVAVIGRYGQGHAAAAHARAWSSLLAARHLTCAEL